MISDLWDKMKCVVPDLKWGTGVSGNNSMDVTGQQALTRFGIKGVARPDVWKAEMQPEFNRNIESR
jgi:hypothetical protein